MKKTQTLVKTELETHRNTTWTHLSLLSAPSAAWRVVGLATPRRSARQGVVRTWGHRRSTTRQCRLQREFWPRTLSEIQTLRTQMPSTSRTAVAILVGVALQSSTSRSATLTDSIHSSCPITTDRGQQNSTSSKTWGFYFSGHLNFKAIVEDIKLKHASSFAKMERILLTGSSAGGIGT